MIRLTSNLGRFVASGVTEEQQAENDQEARRRLFHEHRCVVIPLDHPDVKGGLRAILEGFAVRLYGKPKPRKDVAPRGS